MMQSKASEGEIENGEAACDRAGVASAALSRPQEKALQELVGGLGVKAAAVAAGVHRGTLHRWLLEDANFAAAYHAQREQLRENARMRLMAISDRAVDAIMDAVEKGDTRCALALLKGLGLLSKISPGSTNPEEIAREREVERKNREGKLAMEESMAGLGV
jgi:hypothetical protein